MYNRLFTKILDSSIWLEADTTRLIWITFLATMDEDGYAAFSSVENLSRRANIPLEETKQAVLVLEAPDKFNPNDEFEGRRIERVDNGWMVLKGPLYRGLLSREIQREQTRLRVAKFREKKKLVTNQTLPNVTDVTVTHADAGTDAGTKQKQSKESRERVPSLSQVIEYGKTQGISLQDAEGYFDSQQSGGWKRNGRPLMDWKASLRNWKRYGYLPSQKKQGGKAISDKPKRLDRSKIDLPESFKSWVAEHYPAKREEAMKWQTWADVPSVGLREEWWRERKANLPGELPI